MADLEILGHWAKSSSMPAQYDNAAGVSELQARYTILGALRKGWRPVPEGELPMPIPLSGEILSVGHRVTKRLHKVFSDEGRSLCKMWSCGTSTSPHISASFNPIPGDYKVCDKCATLAMG